jgi:hypothetical protein
MPYFAEVEIASMRTQTNNKLSAQESAFAKELHSAKKLICSPRSILDIIKGIELRKAFRSPPTSRSRQWLDLACTEIDAALKLLALKLDHQFPDSAAEKNIQWRNEIRPRLPALKELNRLRALKEIAIQSGLSPELSPQEIEALLAERRSAHREAKMKRRAEEKERCEAAKSEIRQRLGLDGEADASLAMRLKERAELGLELVATQYSGYLYFKVWVLPDGSRWYKIGISNNPERRHSEQNVLPVPAETISTIRLHSLEHARAVELAFHEVLDGARIRGANNRELFSLKPSQVAAVLGAMKTLGIHGPR